VLVFGGVTDARVHVSYDTRKTSVRRDEDIPMHLSAVLVHEHGIDADGLIQSVKRFLRNSFARIDYNDISVVLVPGESPRLPALTAVRSGWGDGRSYIVSAWIVAGLLIALGAGWWVYRARGLWASKKPWFNWRQWSIWRPGKKFE
jgi:type III secretory pathway lipoprotein EscJ